MASPVFGEIVGERPQSGDQFGQCGQVVVIGAPALQALGGHRLVQTVAKVWREQIAWIHPADGYCGTEDRKFSLRRMPLTSWATVRTVARSCGASSDIDTTSSTGLPANHGCVRSCQRIRDSAT